MEKVRIGVICPSEIAYRRFMPAIKQCEQFEYIGIAVADSNEWNCSDDVRAAENKKAEGFSRDFGGKIFNSYRDLIVSDEIDAIYLPLPPALHYPWGKLALENNKHLFLEKPSTTRPQDTKSLVNIARERGLAVHENYMFQYHSQLNEIKRRIDGGEIGDVRLYRIAFGFPQRDRNDFRYNKKLGGGALLDCGGYTVRLAVLLLGETAEITTSNLNFANDFEVDIYGSATMENDSGTVAQLSFGMDNAYKCDLEVWGSKGTILADRIFTAPVGFRPMLRLKIGNEPEQVVELPADDSFRKSILRFGDCIIDSEIRNQKYSEILYQSNLIDIVDNKKEK